LKKKSEIPAGKLQEIKARKRKRTVTSLIVLISCLLLAFNVESLISLVRGGLNLGGVQFNAVTTLNYSSTVKVSEGKVVQKAGSRMIKAEGGKLQAYQADGKLLWEKPYGGTKVLVSAVGNRIFLVEKDSGDFFILDENGNIKIKREGLGKVDRIIAKSEDYAILYKGLEKKIMVINQKGVDEAVIDLPYPEILDIDYAPDLKLIAVSVFFVEKEGFNTNVFLFGVDGKMKGARNFNSQILSRISGYKKEFIGVSDKGILAFSDENDNLWNQESDRLINRINFNENGYSAYNLVIEDKALEDTRSENTVSVLSPEGTWLFEAKVPMVVDRLFLGENRLAVLGESQVVIMDFKGRTLGSKTVENGLKEILWINDKEIGFEYENRFEWYKLSY
jgi:hypothetical protein